MHSEPFYIRCVDSRYPGELTPVLYKVVFIKKRSGEDVAVKKISA